jgi:hypothetical protein
MTANRSWRPRVAPLPSRPTTEPAQQPERQREQAEHHDHEQNDFEAALSFAE